MPIPLEEFVIIGVNRLIDCFHTANLKMCKMFLTAFTQSVNFKDQLLVV
jgi:hypothetical protein